MDKLIQANVTPEMKDFMERWAAEQECTVASLIRRLIKSEMTRQSVPQITQRSNPGSQQMAA